MECFVCVCILLCLRDWSGFNWMEFFLCLYFRPKQTKEDEEEIFWLTIETRASRANWYYVRAFFVC